jgi:hypothetical protein
MKQRTLAQYKWDKSHSQALKPLNLKSPLEETQTARDTNGIQTVKKLPGIEMKIPILSGNVSKREIIEESTVSARTGNLTSSVRTIPITYVQFFVQGYSLQILW